MCSHICMNVCTYRKTCRISSASFQVASWGVVSGSTFSFICWLGSHNLFHSWLVSTPAFPNELHGVSRPALFGPGKLSRLGHIQGDDLVPSPAIFSRNQLQLAIKNIPFSLLAPSPSPQNTLFPQSTWKNSTESKQEKGGRSHRFVPLKMSLGFYFFLSVYHLYPISESNFCRCAFAHPYTLRVWQREMC